MDLQKILSFLFGRNALQQAQGPQGQSQQSQTQNSENPGINIQQIMAMAQQQAEEERKKKLMAIMMQRGPQWQGPLQQ